MRLAAKGGTEPDIIEAKQICNADFFKMCKQGANAPTHGNSVIVYHIILKYTIIKLLKGSKKRENRVAAVTHRPDFKYALFFARQAKRCF